MGTSPELTSFVGLGSFLELDNRLYPPWLEPETWMKVHVWMVYLLVTYNIIYLKNTEIYKNIKNKTLLLNRMHNRSGWC